MDNGLEKAIEFIRNYSEKIKLTYEKPYLVYFPLRPGILVKMTYEEYNKWVQGKDKSNEPEKIN